MKFKILWTIAALDTALLLPVLFYPCLYLFIRKQSMYNLDSQRLARFLNFLFARPLFLEFCFGNTKCFTRFLELNVQIIGFQVTLCQILSKFLTVFEIFFLNSKFKILAKHLNHRGWAHSLFALQSHVSKWRTTWALACTSPRSSVHQFQVLCISNTRKSVSSDI